MEQLRGWLQDHFLPVVAVAATPAAEAICQGRNGLSLVDLLRTQAHVGGLNGGLSVARSADAAVLTPCRC